VEKAQGAVQIFGTRRLTNGLDPLVQSRHFGDGTVGIRIVALVKNGGRRSGERALIGMAISHCFITRVVFVMTNSTVAVAGIGTPDHAARGVAGDGGLCRAVVGSEGGGGNIWIVPQRTMIRVLLEADLVSLKAI